MPWGTHVPLNTHMPRDPRTIHALEQTCASEHTHFLEFTHDLIMSKLMSKGFLSQLNKKVYVRPQCCDMCNLKPNLKRFISLYLFRQKIDYYSINFILIGCFVFSHF
jgi:hypothetical protein